MFVLIVLVTVMNIRKEFHSKGITESKYLINENKFEFCNVLFCFKDVTIVAVVVVNVCNLLEARN